MARSSPPLDVGDAFPALRVETVAHGQLVLPGDLDARWPVLLVYRAHW